SDNMVRQENIETASTVTNIIPASTVNSDHNSTIMITQSNQTVPIPSELIDLDISNTLQKANNLANNQVPAITPLAAPKKVIDMIMADTNQLQKDNIDIHKASQQQQFQHDKAAKNSEQGQRKGTSHKTVQPGLQNPKDSPGCHGKCISDGQNNDGIREKGGSQIKISEMISEIFDSIPELYEVINDVKSRDSDKHSSICNNLRTNNSRLRKINKTLMCFEKFLRTIKSSNNDNYFGNKINEQYAIIEELTDKYFQFNIAEII
ncbi:hypothetical protein O181_098715, partial [Austropuccinia psidii MF-1]|nr:hypothetical protein [Austropuccinia psidii MF-1]